MATTSGEQRYLAGYNAGRTNCLRGGSSQAARRWLEDHPRLDLAYVAGYEWALWDYDDANGLPRTDDDSRGASAPARRSATGA